MLRDMIRKNSLDKRKRRKNGDSGRRKRQITR